MEWLADRFFLESGRWVDAATGSVVRINIEQASSIDAFDWDEECGRLANARHPLLNPLIDYGAAPDGRRFEAYEYSPPPVDAGGAAVRLLEHAVQFLRTSGITMQASRSRFAMRQVGRGSVAVGRPLGVTLQPRRALAAVCETLESPSAAPSVVTIVGPSTAGLRTTRLLLARYARVLGFIPICSAILVRHPTALPLERHLCVLDDEDIAGRRQVAGALMRLSAASARRHVIVRFVRQGGTRRAIVLDPLSVRALMGMVFADAQSGPTEQELFDAARLADGRPGAFLAHLAACPSAAVRTAMVIHETPADYGVDAPPVERPAAEGERHRLVSAALRAVTRADVLAGRGRHAAAERVLLRGARVLSGRGRAEEAARCFVRAGALALDRGRTREAAVFFEQAQRLSKDGPAAVRAAAGLGSAWIDELRLVEAEAVLRGALGAAETVGDTTGALLVTAALVRCLYHQDRSTDAIGAAATVEWKIDEHPGSVYLLAALSRCHGALGRTGTALKLARRAQVLAREDGYPAIAAADLALADALASAGDLPGTNDLLARLQLESRRHHLPLVAIEAEVAAYEHGAPAGDARTRTRALRRLRALERLSLPRMLRQRVTAAIGSIEKDDARGETSNTASHPSDIHREAADALEMLLQVCQQAADDGAAIAAVCGAMLRRVGAATAMAVAAMERRVLACEGRPWVAHSTVVGQALAAGMPCASDAGVEPREAAEPVRYGGDVIGAVACRWTAGATVDALGAAAVLHAAALAVAGPMRAVLDRAVPQPPDTVWGDLLGQSPAAVSLRDAVARAARAPFSVLVEGESGCGKELVARAIHRLSPRRDRRFCAINCAALTDDLVEAELFGHVRGAFTGAATERAGLFEEADGGTLFLDEIGELSARAQAKLLRVLQEGEVRRVGENFPRRVDARIVAATNRQLEAEAAAGRFRADLRFRLDVIRITVPPLRERPGDIPVLAAHFWNSASSSVGSQATLSTDTITALARYDWPGNVRELQNVIAWMAVHSPRRGRIGPSALPAHVAQCSMPAACSFEAAREEFERRFIRAALANANGQRAKAAEALGITRQGLAKMIKRLGI